MRRGKVEGFVFTDEQDAQAACEWWQKRLRLVDWDVKVKYGTMRQMGLDIEGSCDPVLVLKVALLRLTHAADYPESQWPPDEEETLVHELIHLHFEPFRVKDSSLTDTAQEQAIECLATSFISFRRASYPEPPWRQPCV
jgi:hypothetical protein